MDGNTDWGGEIKISKKGKVICTLGFTVNEQQIYVDTLNTDKGFRHIGYGSLAMDVVKGYSEFLEIPIILYSISNSYPFYERMGFQSCNSDKIQRRIVQLKATEPPDEMDYIWIPKCLSKKRKVVVDV